MIKMPVLDGTFGTPSIVFTLREGNPRSVDVLGALKEREIPAQCVVFNSQTEIESHFTDHGILPASALVLFDRNFGAKRFHPTCRSRAKEESAPSWTMGAQWMVMISDRCDSPLKALGCANQITADFIKNFDRRLGAGKFPWGDGKKTSSGREQPPKPISVLATISKTIAGLNAGPDLAQAIADKSFALELPKGSKISWIRVSDKPLDFDTSMLKKVLASLQAFEMACNRLVYGDVRDLLLAGVDLPVNSLSVLMSSYLAPRVNHFSVGRPDLHYTGENALPFASEIDEMPGGMPELVHIDHVYGINQERWKKAFDWLCEEGKLVFLISNQWSKCYIPETAWLVGHLQKLGYPAEILTTDQIDQIEFRSDRLYLNGERIGTIWRQFPIFEATGKLVDVVLAAYQGRVRLIPEFAHFGNKAWFSIFRSHEAHYRKILDPETFDILDQVLPHSYIVGAGGKEPFPMKVNDVQINSINALQSLPETSRDKLVLKVCGANNLAARSYGVLMGVGIDSKTWSQWVCDRMAAKQPFVVQRRLDAGIARIPVMNTKTGYPELFSCRILARPWSFNGELVSVHGCAVPSQYYRVHGMVDMAVVPFSI